LVLSQFSNDEIMTIQYKSRGSGIPFIFQHGLGSNLEQPQSLLDQLTGIQLISTDCPGHGNSPLPNNQSPSFDYYAEEIIRLMDELKIKKSILGGISMGSGMALNIALKHPEKVSALVLVRPAWLDIPNPENLLILKKAATYIGTPEGSLEFKQQSVYKDIAAQLPLAARSIMGVFAPSQRKEIPTVLDKMVGSCPIEKLENLKQINIPCLIIANEEDPLHPFDMAKTIHHNIPNSQLKKVVSRYVDNGQHKRVVNLLVQEFLDNVI